ncbi:Superkiller viralicidic activity 2-like 2 [Histomonas meleagridis]|uniref:Superkiller viralicidic activity 2-like 2 n=1 Tax=Histomonas meleagridis TaxID=135588 RepID=UPI00355A1A57|nr:Superkiller viralicidic activity 2-like 2 [Histomonas meleagridis]KAH0801129.1 Superkiller viralicidic activity 2-like 2 [Histomonas meleagridis]
MFVPLPDELKEDEGPTSIKFETEGDNVLHYVALPNGQASIENVPFPEEPLLQYEFELDQFQKISIACIHNSESVLVSAHTSAGKTAIAFYAVKAALTKGARVVYTSPIKALSNQKYRELKDEFDDVGLITGDITINPSASCLVMTTEILRMMLYRGDSLIHELYWVIYDEIHYMKDVERGVVWEESIVLLPDEVRFVFLSATIPNSREFSEWIAKIHHQPCHVVYTEYRPVPLNYYLAPRGGDLYKVREGDGPVDKGSLQAAFAMVPTVQISQPKRLFHGISVQMMVSAMKSKQKSDKNANYRLTCEVADSLVNKNLDPILVFAFSRKECDELPYSLENTSYISEEDSQKVEQLAEVAIEKLSESDKKLPQIDKLKSLVVRGIGIHHGGLIPLMKEFVELLFQHGLIRILFATETFAMGLNMPARTVIFHSLYKFDGQQRRILSGGEFIQMSGRAGRRNNDTFGSVVIVINDTNDETETLQLLESPSQPLNSEYHITYHMLLSLLCSSQIKPEDLMRKSFHQFQMERQIPILNNELEKYNNIITEFEIPNEAKIRMRVEIDEQLEHFNNELHNLIYNPENIGTFITKGRIVQVANGWGWGIVVATTNKKTNEALIALKGQETITKTLIPIQTNEGASAYIFSVDFNDIIGISEESIDFNNDQLSGTTINRMFNSLDKIISKGIKILNERDLITKNKDTYDSYIEKIGNLRKLSEQFVDITIFDINKYKEKREIQQKIKDLRQRIQILNAAVMQEDLKSMQNVLEKLGFVDNEKLITNKGRVASIISAGDELVITEMLFDGILKHLTPQQIASLLCIFACDSGSKEEAEIPEDLSEQWEQTKEIVKRIVEISRESGINTNFDDYMKNIDPTFMLLTYNWAGGAEFAQLMEDNPQFFEGAVIRSMKRTEEILRQTARAANQMGDSDLELMIMQAIKLIKRDIIFAASLYL